MDSTFRMVPPVETAGPSITVYRTKFHLETEQTFRLRWFADEHAELFLNGEFLCAGPAGCTPRRWFLENFERPLPAGDYTLTARVTMFGRNLAPHAQESVAFGFYAESEQLTNGWECQVLRHLKFTPPYPDWAMAPRMTAAPEFNWRALEGEDGKWESVAFREDTRPLFPRPVPPMEEKPERAYRIIERPDGSKLFVFDRYVCVWSDFRFRGTGSVSIRWTETLYRPGSFQTRDLIGDKGDRRIFEGKEWIGNATVLNLPGGTVRWRDCEWKSGRYLLLEFTGDAGLESAEFTSVLYPWKREWRVKSSSPEFDRALELAWNTLRMCSHETFMDCPFFERLQYVSDSRLESLTALVTTRDTRIITAALRSFADSQVSNGLIYSRTPSKQEQVIPSFALIYILFLHDVAQWRSPELVREFIPCARRILEYFDRQAVDGLVHFPGWRFVDTPGWKPGEKGWNFVDWVDGWPDGVPAGDCTLNIFRLLALETMAKLDPEQLFKWQASARTAAAAIRRTYEVPGKGFAEDEAHATFSEHAQVLAVLSENLPDYAPDLPGAAPCSVSFSYYYLEAVRKLRRGDLFRKRLARWFEADRSGLCTFPENFDNPRSDCHAWSSHILHHCFASILGLRPADAGHGILELNPLPIGLAFLEGEIPLGDGTLRFRMEENADGVKLEYENSSSCEIRRAES